MNRCRPAFWAALSVCALSTSLAHGWTAVPGGRLNEVMIDDFEGGALHEQDVNPLPDGFGWQKTTYAGQFTWAVDPAVGANGTSKSMKVTTQTTVPYWYFMHNSRDKYILDGYDKPVNRMEYYIRLPQNWMRDIYLLTGIEYSFENFNVGTYQRDPNLTLASSSATETYGWHFYYQLIYNMYDTSWVRVQLNQWPQHMRADNKNPGAYPCKPQGDLFSNWTRAYFCGVPYDHDAGAGYPYDMWFDQWCFYYEPEYVTMNPEYGEGSGTAGSVIGYPVVVANTHPSQNREFGLFLSTNLYNSTNYWTYNVHLYEDTNGNGMHEAGETTEPATTGTLAPGAKWRGVLVATIASSGPGSEVGAYVQTAVVAWQKTPAYTGLDPHISKSRVKIGGVPSDDPAAVLQGTPCVGANIITRTVASPPAADTTAPAAVNDLCVTAIGQRDAKVRWTAVGDNGQQGTAYAYEARYSTATITPASWDSCTELTGEPDVWPAGVAQTWWTPPVLQPGTTYYLAIKVIDMSRNVSGLSNVVSFTTAVSQPGNVAPVAAAGATPSSGTTPLAVQLSSAGSSDSDGQITQYFWDFGDGAMSNLPNPSHTFDIVGANTVTLTVVDNAGASHQTSLTVTTTRGSSGKILLRYGRDGYASGLSNAIYAGYPTTVDLGGTNFKVGNYGNKIRGLFQFNNLTAGLALPANTSVTSAKLLLYHQANSFSGPTDLQIYNLTAPYTPQQASWTYASSGVPWTTAGAVPSGASVYATVTDERHALMQRSWDVTNLVSAGQNVLNAALRTPLEDITDGGYVVLGTHDYTDPSQRPTLLVAYSGNNLAPTVDAGNNQTITLPAAANLDGTVSDDGLPNPPATVTTTWSKVSGPGTVTFGNASAVDTTATFSTNGTYVLQLLADDSALQSTDTLTITVNSGSGGTTVTLQNGVLPDASYAGCIDTVMANGSFADTNYGVELYGTGMGEYAGTRRSLIRFDVSSIPATATVSSSKLRLKMSKVDQNRTLEAYQVMRPWTQLGCTWNNYNGTNPWTTAGCAGTGTDRAGTAAGTVNVLTSDLNDWIEIPLSPSLVQGWVAGSIVNDGVLLKVTDESAYEMRFYPENHTALADRPQLVIDYSLNHPPIAQDGSAQTNQDTAANITLQATDADNDPLTYIIVTGPGHGTLSDDDGDNLVIYTPAPGYTGSDSFTFKASDTHADSNSATINITVNAAAPTTVTFQNGVSPSPSYTGCIDTWISSAPNDNANYGLETWGDGIGEYGGTKRSLVRFDVSSIPSGATVSSAKLRLKLSKVEQNRTLEAYQVMRPWTQTGCTWNKYDGTGTWTTAGCAGIGADRSGTAAGTVSVATTDVNNWIEIPLSASLVQAWVAGSSANNGVLLKVTDESAYEMRFYPENNSTLADRPVFVVTYTTGSPTNAAPTVEAGIDQTIALPTNVASLSGTVSDDARPNPPGTVTVTWSKFSGPGTVTFGNANAVSTTATFSAAGTYVLQLMADDNALQSTDTVTITVNLQPTVQFSSASGSGSESVTSVSVPVALSAASTNTVTVSYAVTGGTATGGGIDYTLNSGVLTFSPGVTSQNIPVTVINDTAGEYNETIQVTLSNPSNATLGANTFHTYTINDDDVMDCPATADTPLYGTVSGTFADTQTSNNVYESIREVLRSGSNYNYSWLEHKWTFNVRAGSAIQFRLEAYRPTNSDSDNFQFAYSTDGNTWTNMLTVSKSSDDNADQTYSLPAGTSGTVYVRVQDTNRAKNKASLDYLYVDHMVIRSTP